MFYISHQRYDAKQISSTVGLFKPPLFV